HAEGPRRQPLDHGRPIERSDGSRHLPECREVLPLASGAGRKAVLSFSHRRRDLGILTCRLVTSNGANLGLVVGSTPPSSARMTTMTRSPRKRSVRRAACELRAWGTPSRAAAHAGRG